MRLDDLYRRVIMDHYQKPRNRGSIESGTFTIEMNNPTCGDRIFLHMIVENGTIEEAKFDGEGCSISIASASMMTEAIKGKDVKTALELADRFSHLMQGKDVEFEELEDIEALQGVSKFPARIKCATLAWKALEKGVHQNSNEV
jgi:nitrogen fixation NifU-like protein